MPAKKSKQTTANTLEGAIAAVMSLYKTFAPPVQLTETNLYDKINYSRSGCLALDWILANHNPKGGLPRGRLIEVYGPEMSGKTTLLTIAAAKVQKRKEKNKVVFIDLEHSYDLPYAVSMGVDLSKLCYVQPAGETAGEEAMEFLIQCCKADDVGLIIVDSITALVTKQEMSGDLGDANIGSVARLQTQAIKRFINILNPESPTVAFISQLRDNIGVMFGSNEKVPGARAIKFFASCRVDVRGKEKIKDDDDNIIGQNVKLKAAKNKVGRPFQEEIIELIFGEGFNNIAWIINKAESLGVLITAGRSYILPDKTKMTEAQLTEHLSNNAELQSLYRQCIEKNNQNLNTEDSAEPASVEEKQSAEEADLTDLASEEVDAF